MRGVARRNKARERVIAAERVERLAQLAEEALLEHRPDRAARYGALAWAVKTRYQLKGSPIDKRVCRQCHAYLGPGTARVRLTGGKRTVTCLMCGNARRRPL